MSFFNLSWMPNTMIILLAWVGLLLGCYIIFFYIMSWINPLGNGGTG